METNNTDTATPGETKHNTGPEKPKKPNAVAWISLVTAIVSLVLAGFGLINSYFTKHEIDTLHGIHDNLAKTTYTQYLATTREVEKQREESERQAERIRQLVDQQKQVEHSLIKAKNTESIRQLLLSQRKEIRDLWARVELKDLYRDISPRPPQSGSLSDIANLSGVDFAGRLRPLSNNDFIIVQEYTRLEMQICLWRNYNNVHWKSNRAVDQSEPLLLQIFWKEIRFCETAKEAITLGIISELPQDVENKFKSTLKTYPDRPIYHFAGETNWWTVFEELDSFHYAIDGK